MTGADPARLPDTGADWRIALLAAGLLAAGAGILRWVR